MTSPCWKLDDESADEALRLLRRANLVLMPTHQNVDADGLSSPLALMLALRQQGVTAVPLITDGQLPSNLSFLPGYDQVLVYGKDELPDFDLICMVDCADRKRLGQFYKDDPERVNGAYPIVNIDHHVTNDAFGVINIIEPTAASAAELVADLLALWGTELTQAIAQCLLTGIYGDTLGLRTDSTTSRTMRTAADLVDAGANPAPIVDSLFRVKPRSTVCLWAKALQNVQWTGQLIWTELTSDTFKSCAAEPGEGEGLVNFLLGTDGSQVAAILYANDHGWRVSLRSMPGDTDVAALAAQFGGGGHPRAAGLQIEGGETEKRAFLHRAAALIAGDPEDAAPAAT